MGKTKTTAYEKRVGAWNEVRRGNSLIILTTSAIAHYMYASLMLLQVLEEFKRTCQALSEKLGRNRFFINDR